MSELPDLPPAAFAKVDPTPDSLFYALPRFVTHLDARAIAGVTELYRAKLPDNATVLDLMSSWISHLPSDRVYRAVIGHGLNAQELAANPRLTRWFVQDLNLDPHLPLDAASVDAVTMCASVQYLQKPVALFGEVRRVLRPGGIVVITFSNRCFPTKAVAIWTRLSAADRTGLVRRYLEQAGFSSISGDDIIPEGGGTDPLHAVAGRK